MRVIVVFDFGRRTLFGFKYFIAPPYGQDVEARFIEHSKFIPSMTSAPSSAATAPSNFARWLTGPEYEQSRAGYVAPVILPFDILYMMPWAACWGLLRRSWQAWSTRFRVSRA
jgi:hypothetical protein